MKIKLSATSIIKLRNSKKTFILYRLNTERNRIVDFVLTDNLSRFRNQYNNKFKISNRYKKKV